MFRFFRHSLARPLLQLVDGVVSFVLAQAFLPGKHHAGVRVRQTDAFPLVTHSFVNAVLFKLLFLGDVQDTLVLVQFLVVFHVQRFSNVIVVPEHDGVGLAERRSLPRHEFLALFVLVARLVFAPFYLVVLRAFVVIRLFLTNNSHL